MTAEKLSVEPIDDERWALVASWLVARDMGEPLPRDHYPPTGFVVDGCVAGFLFRTDCRVAYIGSIVSDPRSTRERRRGAIRALLDALMAEARAAGFALVLSSPSVGSLVERFAEAGCRPVRKCTFVAGVV